MDYVSDGSTNHERQESNSVSYLETAERDADDRRLAEENERLRAEVARLREENARLLGKTPPRVPDSAAEEMFRAKS